MDYYSRWTGDVRIKLLGYGLFGAFSLLFVIFSLLFGIPLYLELFQVPNKRNRPFVERKYFKPDRELGWRLYPNITVYNSDEHGNDKEVYFSTNSQGFRKTPSIYVKNDKKILLLGDSFAQGYYLYDDETIAFHLSRLTQSSVENAGVGAYSTDQEYTVLKKATKKRSYDNVIVLFFINDISHIDKQKAWGLTKPRYHIEEGTVDFGKLMKVDVVNRTGNSKRETNFNTKYSATTFVTNVMSNAKLIWEPLPNFPQSFEVIQTLIADNKFSVFDFQYQPEFYKYPEKVGPWWDLTFQFLEEMKRMVEAQGGRFTVLQIPEVAQIVNSSPDVLFKVQKLFMAICLERRIECIEPHQRFLEDHQENELYIMDDGHLSPAGSQLVSKILYENIFSE